jgi:hypothetical protein
MNEMIEAINNHDWKQVGRLLAKTGNPLSSAILMLQSLQSAHCTVTADVVLNNSIYFSSNVFPPKDKNGEPIRT